MRQFEHAVARPAGWFRSALLPSIVILILLAATGAATAQTATDTLPILYRLDKGSNYEQGCFGPCACPVLVSTPAAGTFVLTPAGFDGLFNNFKVTDINWIVSINGADTFVTGSGTYKVGGEFAVQQELVLDLKVGDGAVQHFDSGLVGSTVPYPGIDVTVSVNGMTCFDTVFHVVTSPVPVNQIRTYRLVSGSSFQRGCFNACDCAVGAKLPMTGNFALVPLVSASPWNEFAVVNARWRVLDSTATGALSGFPVRGEGVYLFGGDFAVQQRMNLIMKVDKEAPAHFDSGLVVGGGTPRIDVRVSVVGAVCVDTILEIHAEPRKLFRQSPRTDGDAP
jgi:hypothetical protein